jgi:hypothetical protein
MSSDWMRGGAREPQGIDTMQVCKNGHMITHTAEHMPERRKAFCDDCGAPTITACPECNRKIPGLDWDSPVIGGGRKTPPNYCLDCGSAYPWHQAAIVNAIETLEELGVTGDDIQTAIVALPELIGETPKAEVSALRMKRVLKSLGKPAYDVGIKVVSDLVSQTVRKLLT